MKNLLAALFAMSLAVMAHAQIFAPYELYGYPPPPATPDGSNFHFTVPPGANAVTWAFGHGKCGEEVWFRNFQGAQVAAANIPLFIASGKKYIVSVGGGNAPQMVFKCDNQAGMLKFVQTYYSPNMLGIDFDIEGQNKYTDADIDALIHQIQYIQNQTAHPEYNNIRWSFNIGGYFGGGENNHYNVLGNAIIDRLKHYTINNYVIQIQVMDYLNDPSHCIQKADLSGCQIALSGIEDIKNVHKFFNIPYSKIAINPGLGVNDFGYDVFTLEDAAVLAQFAIDYGLAGISPWSISNDQSCAPAAYNNMTCHGIPGLPNFAFTKTFLTYLPH